ncbi:tRNA (adenosine(37)-N6)-dimethylallyltransferase MiaA [Aestuariivivens sediminis]|uniref:tRNA (adenosine(37)-N6)-dimethylallyltransferase MiaA n=1 Tax=Aestuariivivens sediminis TaxID=2913557 RepID=UPI001F55B2E0|nr:tRNA (adenosine(37)-N6)-dimethylallyltransferase MiaA [Aestuariivivens sediminis]
MMPSFALNVVPGYIMTKYVLSIIGPTAIGKTALSIKVAQHFKTEILSADSRQFFKEMAIGTAVPSPEELSKVKHHFIHHKSIHDSYNVGAFEKDAINRLEDLYKTQNIVVMVGGSGLYVDAITKGLDDFPNVDPKIRTRLNRELETKGLEPLQDQLKALDLNAYHTIAIANPHRVIRALEVCIGTNKPYSSYLNKLKDNRPFKTITIGLTADREIIYDRINRRVDTMIEAGLLDEVKTLLPHRHLNALNTVGYKELFRYFEGQWPLEFAISEIKKNSRRFAKRQLTWFRKDPDILWFEHNTSTEHIVQSLQAAIPFKNGTS